MSYSECFDCVVDWSEWSSCSNGERSRSTKILFEPLGAGKPCPELETETEGIVCFSTE